MVQRRNVLRSAGRLGAVGIAAGLAGCTDAVDDAVGGDGSEDDSTGSGGGGTNADGDGSSDGSDGDESSDGGEEGSDQLPAAAELTTARERLGSLADDLSEVVRVSSVDLDDVDPEGGLQEARAALDEAEAAVETDEGRAQLETLEALFSVLANGVDGGASIVRDGVAAVQAGIEAQRRTEQHRVEVEFDPQTGEVGNPQEVIGMLCSMLAELDDAATSFEEASTAVEDGITALEEAQSTFEGIRSDLQSYDEINVLSITVALSGPGEFAAELTGVIEGLATFVEASSTRNRGSILLGLFTTEHEGPFECQNGAFTTDGRPDLEADVRPAFAGATDAYGAASDTLSGLDGSVLGEELMVAADTYACLATAFGDAAELRTGAVDALLANDREAYAQRLGEALQTESDAPASCQ